MRDGSFDWKNHIPYGMKISKPDNNIYSAPQDGIYVYVQIPTEFSKEDLKNRNIQCKDLFENEIVNVSALFYQVTEKYIIAYDELKRQCYNKNVYPDMLFRIDWDYSEHRTGKNWLNMSILSIHGYRTGNTRRLVTNKRQKILQAMIDRGYFIEEVEDEIQKLLDQSEYFEGREGAYRDWFIDKQFLERQRYELGDKVLDREYKAAIERGLVRKGYRRRAWYERLDAEPMTNEEIENYLETIDHLRDRRNNPEFY